MASATGKSKNLLPRNKPVSRKKWSNRVSFFLLAGPALIWFLIVMGWPLVNMFYVSTMEWKSVIHPRQFIGLENFIKMFSTEKFFVSLQNTVIYLVVLLAIVLPLSFILGFFLSRRLPGNRFFRTVFFVPNMLSAPALAMLFVGIFLPDGIINFLLTSVGLESLTRVWLANTSTALYAIILVDIWGAVGFFSILMYATLVNIPPELFEAAKLDGANIWQVMWRIAFPLAFDIFGLSLMIMYIGTLNQAQNIVLLTRGGPGSSTYTLGYYLYEMAFSAQRLGYSQAVGVFILVVGLAGAVIIRRLTTRNYQY